MFYACHLNVLYLFASLRAATHKSFDPNQNDRAARPSVWHSGGPLADAG